MKRREFISKVGAGSLALGAVATAGCQQKPADCGPTDAAKSAAAPASSRPIEWKMVTTWPKNFPGLGTGANFLAKTIEDMSGGRIRVKVYGAGEMAPAFEIFDVVSKGAAELGHGSAYYWKGKNPALQFFSTVPFGLTADEMNAWLYHGGGMELWREAYKPFGLAPMAAGNTGVQMAGWFNKEINSLDDLKGLKMRIPGLGGEVLKRAGGTPVNLPGGELFTAMQSGALDATEWVNPYNDLAFGLFKAAKYYYYPGWHEPGTTLECFVNQKAFDALPSDLQSIVLNAARVANQDMLAEYIARNNDALVKLVDEHKVDVRKLPDDVIENLRTLSDEVVAEVAAGSEQAKKIYESYRAFREKVMRWEEISEKAYLMARG
ncbi:MAG TPA: TRAP transporter substrate-binding protein [Gammaproteobacteria bacterium]|nr:TRAP transporter substrate-binding protein [Gammaproteobacteria bacterium]